MSDSDHTTGTTSLLKQKLFEALRTSVSSTESGSSRPEKPVESVRTFQGRSSGFLPERAPHKAREKDLPEKDLDSPLSAELLESKQRLELQMEAVKKHAAIEVTPDRGVSKQEFDDTLTMRGMVPDAQTEALFSAEVPSSTSQANNVKSDSSISGGRMADLSGYKDLSKAPISFGEEEVHTSPLAPDLGFERAHFQSVPQQQSFSAAQHFAQEAIPQEVDTEFSGNVKTLIRLVNELPEGVTKQTGAQIIRLTMEAMGISMEDVLSEAQSAQSEMLDAVRANIKKIEEYKTVIRKLETDIKYYQGKANELSEIIDLFILSNTSGGKMGNPEDMSH
ncbi:hypothetical protein [Vampirovibrio chlorellavorus]|nr:hypothetical protein [Vampirovibrio chlorellavorus]